MKTRNRTSLPVYKVGDEVIIREWQDMEKEYGLNGAGDIDIPQLCFAIEMRRYCGTKLRINHISEDGEISMYGNEFGWIGEMFEPDFDEN